MWIFCHWSWTLSHLYCTECPAFGGILLTFSWLGAPKHPWVAMGVGETLPGRTPKSPSSPTSLFLAIGAALRIASVSRMHWPTCLLQIYFAHQSSHSTLTWSQPRLIRCSSSQSPKKERHTPRTMGCDCLRLDLRAVSLALPWLVTPDQEGPRGFLQREWFL